MISFGEVAKGYSEVSGYYDYGNGERYEVSGLIAAEHGGGAYKAGEKIFAGSSEKDLFDKETNETGNKGFYVFDDVVNHEGSGTTSLTIGRYYDLETELWIRPYETSDGSKGLGSEQGYLTSEKTDDFDQFNHFHEADVDLRQYSEVSGYYDYGNGERYEVSGLIADEHGGGAYKVGEKIYASTSDKDAFNNDTNETGNKGYYVFDSVVNHDGVKTSQRLVVIMILRQRHGSSSRNYRRFSGPWLGARLLTSENQMSLINSIPFLKPMQANTLLSKESIITAMATGMNSREISMMSMMEEPSKLETRFMAQHLTRMPLIAKQTKPVQRVGMS